MKGDNWYLSDYVPRWVVFVILALFFICALLIAGNKLL